MYVFCKDIEIFALLLEAKFWAYIYIIYKFILKQVSFFIWFIW